MGVPDHVFAIARVISANKCVATIASRVQAGRGNVYMCTTSPMEPQPWKCAWIYERGCCKYAPHMSRISINGESLVSSLLMQ